MYEYKLIRSHRKTISLKVLDDGALEVRSPLFVSRRTIDNFVLSHTAWIDKQRIRKKQRLAEHEALTKEKINELKLKAKEILPKKVQYYSALMGLKPNSVKITSAKKRFGSCSSKGGICFSYRLMLYPNDAIDYVVVHELAHLKHHNHSKQFYELVRQYIPNYKEKEKILKGN